MGLPYIREIQVQGYRVVYGQGRYAARRRKRERAPSTEELQAVLPWLEQQDGNPDWPAYVREVLADVSRRLGHGL